MPYSNYDNSMQGDIKNAVKTVENKKKKKKKRKSMTGNPHKYGGSNVGGASMGGGT